MTRKDLSKQRMIFAGIITVIIFALGLTLGLVIDYQRLYHSERVNGDQELNYQSLQLQYLFLSDIGESEESCQILGAALQNSIQELGKSLDEYERFSENSVLNRGEYRMLQRKYLQDNLRYWVFAKRLQDQCASDVTTVLYFYSDVDCPVCGNQGTVLTYFKNKLEDKLLVFPINMDLAGEEQFLELITLTYNVSSVPTIVLNGERYEGVVGRQDLSRIICETKENKEECLL